MTRTIKLFSSSLIAFLISMLTTLPVMAIPVLPSSFYGTVKVNGENVTAGTLVQALIEGEVYAEGFTQIYQEESVYVMDVPGDDSDTEKQDGGQEGDSIQFKIGGVLADQTGIWHGGTNANLDLTAASTASLPTPKPTFTAVPTQTSIPPALPTSTPTTSVQVPVSETAIEPAQNLVTPTVRVHSTAISPKLSPPTSIPAVRELSPTPEPVLLNDINNGPDPSSQLGVVIVIVSVAFAAGGVLWYFRRKNLSSSSR